MAISGQFIADFSSFQAAVQKAEVSLKSFETGSGKVATQLDRMANSLSGTKIVQQATIAAEAVERIGGVSKLTAAELARVGGIASEAAEKLRALGQEVPAGIQSIANEAKRASTEFTNLSGGLTSVNRLLGAFGAAVSVGAVVNFGKLVFDSASQIHDLALELGISTDALQGFKAAAQASGSDIEAVGKAINKMNDALATGSDSTVAAFKAAGLEIEKVRAMSVEDAFLAITDAIQTIPDPALRAQVRLELFGKAGNALGTAIQEGFRQVAEAADKMSAQTIKDLEAAQDAWEKLGNQVVIVSGKMIASTISATREITSSWQSFVQFAGNVISVGPGIATAMAAMGDAANQTATQMDKVAASTGPTITEQNKQAAAAKKAASDQKQAQEEFARSLEQAINQAERLFASLDKLNLINVGLRESVGGVADGTLEEVRAFLQAQKAVDALYESIRKLEQVKAGDIDIGKLPSGTVDIETIARLKSQLNTKPAEDSLRALSSAIADFGSVVQGSVGDFAVGTARILDSIAGLQRAIDTFGASSLSAIALAFQVGLAIGQLIARFKEEIIRAFEAIGRAIKGLFNILTFGLFSGGGSGAIGDAARRAAGHAATGGIVTPFGIQPFAPSGLDTVPTWLAPNEVILNPAQQRDVARQSTGGTTVNVHMDNRGSWFGTNADQELTRRVVMALKGNKGGHVSTLRGVLALKS